MNQLFFLVKLQLHRAISLRICFAENIVGNSSSSNVDIFSGHSLGIRLSIKLSCMDVSIIYHDATHVMAFIISPSDQGRFMFWIWSATIYGHKILKSNTLEIQTFTIIIGERTGRMYTSFKICKKTFLDIFYIKSAFQTILQGIYFVNVIFKT